MNLGIEDFIVGTIIGFSPNRRAAHIAPRVRLRETGPTRVDPTEFPNRGQVVLFDPHSSLQEEQLYQFAVLPTLNFDPASRGRDAYQATNVMQLDPVWDGRPLGDIDAIRVALTERGVTLTGGASTRRTYILVDDVHLAGPVELIRDGDRWRLRSDSLPAAMDLFAVPTADLLPLFSDPHALALRGRRHLRRIGQIDWSTDDALLAHVLNDMRALDGDFAGAVDVTRRSVDRISGLAAAGGGTQEQQFLRRQRLERARKILASAESVVPLASEVAALFERMPSIRQRLDEIRRREAEVVRVEVTTLINKQLASERAEVERLERYKHDLTIQMSDVERRLSGLRADFARETSNFEAALGRRLEQIAQTPHELLADVAILRTALPRLQSRPPSRTALFDRETVDVQVLESLAEIGAVAAQKFAESGLGAASGRALFAAAVASRAILVEGERASDAAALLAGTLAAGRLVRIPCSPRMASVEDVLKVRVEWWLPEEVAPLTVRDVLTEQNGCVVLYLEHANATDLLLTVAPLVSLAGSATSRWAATAVIVCELSIEHIRLPVAARAWRRMPFHRISSSNGLHISEVGGRLFECGTDAIDAMRAATMSGDGTGVLHQSADHASIEGRAAAARFHALLRMAGASEAEADAMTLLCVLIPAAGIDVEMPRNLAVPEGFAEQVQDVREIVRVLRT